MHNIQWLKLAQYGAMKPASLVQPRFRVLDCDHGAADGRSA
jgi:hypothetical protein